MHPVLILKNDAPVFDLVSCRMLLLNNKKRTSIPAIGPLLLANRRVLLMLEKYGSSPESEFAALSLTL